MYLPNNCKLLQIALKMRRPIVVLCCGIKVLVVSSTVLCSLVFLHRLYSYSQEATVAPHSYKEDPQTSGEDYPLPRNQPHTQLVHFSNTHLSQKASPFITGDHTIAKSTLPTEKGMNSIPNKETGKSINLNIATEEINNNTAAAVVTGAQRTAMTFPSPVANSLFTIKPYFHWPQPQSIKPMETLVESGWIRELHKTLLHMNTSQVTLVTSNQAYTEVI